MSSIRFCEYKAPQFVPSVAKPSVFLAGAIDMGAAEKWQEKAAAMLIERHMFVLNPRRDDWDSSWVQVPENVQFREQVEWELDGLENATGVLVHFPASSMAPITLLELGMVLNRRNVIVSCEPGYPRMGNILIICERRGVPVITQGLAHAISFMDARIGFGRVR